MVAANIFEKLFQEEEAHVRRSVLGCVELCGINL